MADLPGLREWGSGLEALAECYFKYVEGCVVEVGRTFQRTKGITHPVVSRSIYPYDIDLIAVNPAQRNVILISCSESWNKPSERTQREFQHYEDFVRKSEELGWGDKVAIQRKIVCIKIPDRTRQELLKKGIEIVEAKFMLEKLLNLVRRAKAKKRKGAHLEPLLWLLQTLDNMGKIDW